MALIKSYELPSGVVAEYWKLVKAEFDITTGLVTLTVFLFVDQAAKDEGKTPVLAEQFQLAIAGYIAVAGGTIIGSGYANLKTIDRFADAVDG